MVNTNNLSPLAQFTIDIIGRRIVNQPTSKVVLTQYDHNSDLFAFEAPRYVCGHDMAHCSKVQIHYINTAAANTKTPQTSVGVYEISGNDIVVNETANTIKFDWLISQNATRYAGVLSFLVRFVCLDGNNELTYVWSSAVYSDVTVSDGMNNDEEIFVKYPDIIEAWKGEIYRRLEGYDKVIAESAKTVKQLEDTVGDLENTITDLVAKVAELDERVIALEPKTISVDYSSYQTMDGWEDWWGQNNHKLEINGEVISINADGSGARGKHTDVKSLRIYVDGNYYQDQYGGHVVYRIGDNDVYLYGSDVGESGWIDIELTDNVTIVGSYAHTCLAGDTMITLADGTYKRIDEVEVGDSVRAIDPETLKVVADTVTHSDAGANKTANAYDVWTFSDGTIVKTIHRHRFYNLERQAMVYMDEWEIGEHGYNEKGEAVELVSHERVHEGITFYTIFTKKNTYFANGLLSGNRFTEAMQIR